MSPDPHFTFTGLCSTGWIFLRKNWLVVPIRGGEYIGLLAPMGQRWQRGMGSWQYFELAPLEIHKVQLWPVEICIRYIQTRGWLWICEVPIGDFQMVNQDGVIRSVPAFCKPCLEPPFSKSVRTVINSSPLSRSRIRRNDRINFCFGPGRGDLLKLTVTYPDDKTRTAGIS